MEKGGRREVNTVHEEGVGVSLFVYIVKRWCMLIMFALGATQSILLPMTVCLLVCVNCVHVIMSTIIEG